MKDIGLADRAERAHGTARVHVIASNHEPAASGTKPQDAGAIFIMQTIADIDREQP